MAAIHTLNFVQPKEKKKKLGFHNVHVISLYCLQLTPSLTINPRNNVWSIRLSRHRSRARLQHQHRLRLRHDVGSCELHQHRNLEVVVVGRGTFAK
jgi:hypothetical protein